MTKSLLWQLFALIFIISTSWITYSSSSSSPILPHLSCTSSDLSIMQSLSCPDGIIGLTSSCQCDNPSGCHLAYLKEYLPPLSLLMLSSWNQTQQLCNHYFQKLFFQNIYQKSSFIQSHGYPLDIDQELCQQKEELSFISKRRYHPCSVSIGKFLRYNSLFEYHLFGRGTRVHGYEGKSHAKDTLVDIHYNYPWRWAQGISECESRNLTSWNCAFSEVSKAFSDKSLFEKSNQQYVVRGLCNIPHVNHVVDTESSKKSRKRKIQTRELRDTCDMDEVNYSSIKLVSSKKMFKLLRDYRVFRPNHISQILFYGQILVMLSRPSDPVWDFLKSNLIFLPSSKTHDSAKARDDLLRHLQEVRNGQYYGRPVSRGSEGIISVSMHVRQGDSCDYQTMYELPLESRYLSSRTGQRPCYHVDVYMRRLYALREKYGVNRVYLATDSQEMISRIQYEKQFDWIYVNTPRDIFRSTTASTSNAASEAAESTKKWVDFYPQSFNSIVTYSAVCDLFLMKFGDIFLGAFTSHFSKLAYYLLVGSHLSLMPFVSLDYPLACDTVDDCSKKDIDQRNPSIEMIINWAPECLRQNDGGWMRESRDPCGIYL